MADASISAPVADPTETAVESQADNTDGSVEVLGALPGHGKRIAPLETPPPDNPFQKMELSPAEFPQKIVSPSVPANPQPGKILDDPFKSMDLSTDEFPTANPTVKDAFNDTLDIHPDKAAEVLKLSNKLGQPPAFVGSNLEASKQAASMPPENYFADLEKKYPVTAKYLSDKQKMAVAKDDIENLTQTEHAVSQYGFFQTMSKAILIGLNRTMAEATQMVPGVSQAALLPFNLTSKLTGHPEQQVRVPEWLQFEAEHNYWEQKAEEHSTHDYVRTVSEALTEGGLPGLGKTLAAKVVAGSPQVAGLIVATLMGAETPALIGMAGMTIGDIERQGRLAGTDPTKTSINALAQAGIQTSLMHIGTLGKLGKWSEAITNVVGKDTAAMIMKDIGKNIASAFIGMGTQQAISGYTGEVGDVLTGLKPSESLTGAGSRAAENFLVGGVTGVALAGIPASFGGYARAFRMKQAEMASNVYKAMGTGAEASKYRERLKDGYKEYIQAVTKGTATDHSYIPADAFDTYFQSKNIDPNEVAKGLGVGDQLQQARETGGNLKIPMDQWIDKVVGTEHFAALADDVKFNESELTVNQAKAEAKAATDAVFKEADAAAKDNPVVAEGRDFIYKDFATKLSASGAYDNQKERDKMIDAHAKLAAAVITGESVRAGIENPKDYYLNGKPLDVVSGQAPSQSAAAQTQSDILQQEAQAKFYSQVSSTIDQKMPAKAAAGDILGILNNTPGVKQEELQWTGLKEWLGEQKGPVTKEQVQQFLRENQVQLQEVAKGTNASMSREAFDALPESEQTRLAESNDKTKFQSYQLPGGQNYREMLLTLPPNKNEIQQWRAVRKDGHVDSTYDTEAGAQARASEIGGTVRQDKTIKTEGGFRSAHFDEPNILAHIRFNDRYTNADGTSYTPPQKTLFIEEIQSDWHQKGREAGYGNRYRVTGSRDGAPFFEDFPTMDAAKTRSAELKDGGAVVDGISLHTGVPNAPFKKSWHELALKRMLRYAAENGYEKIAWTTGEQQAERYDLSKQIDSITWWKGQDGLYGIRADKGNESPVKQDGLKAEQLSNLVGKDIAKKIVDGEGKDESVKRNVGGIEAGKLSGLDLKVGGEGMKGFYDQIIPSFLNKYAKKWGGRVGTTEIKASIENHPPGTMVEQRQGESVNDAMARMAAEVARPIPVHSLDITPSMKESVMQGQPLFQGDPEVDPRGFIQFTPQKTIIGLLKADASTFPHELAHYWLNNFHDFVKSGTAKENHLDDWKILSDWMKVEDGQEKLKPDQHEQFARGFEAYLREGKAPSEGLRGVFSRFQRWLTKLYRDPIALNVALNPDVRAVMDRMLASEDEIAHARQQMGMDLVSDPSKLEPSVRARLEKLRQDSSDKAVSELTSEQMKELTAKYQTKLTEESTKARKQAEADLKVTQVQTSIEAIRHTFGKDPREIAGNWRIGKLNEKQSEQLERLAEARGFSGADELTLKVMNEQSLAKQVDDAVAKHMEQFAYLKDTNKIKEEALRIVHNDKQTELLAHERAIFQSLVDEAQGRATDAKQRRAEAQVAIRATKERATEIISKAPVREAGSFMKYFTAERQAAVSAQKAAESGNYAEAAAAKQRQMINHALASESMKARKEIEKTVRFIDRFASRGQDLKDIPYGIMRHIDKLLGDRGFLAEPRKEDTLTLLKIAQDMAAKSKNLDDSKDEIANLTGFVTDGTGNWHQESLSETAQRFTDNYLPVIIPDSVLHGSGSYKDSTLSELRDLKDTIKSLNTVGRSHDNFITEGITASMKAVAAEFRASVEKNIGRPLERALLPGNQFDSKIAEKVDALMKAPGDVMVAELVRFHTFMKYLDGGAEDGPAQNYFYRILKHGENERFRRSDKMKVEVNKIFEDHYAPGELAKYENERKYFDFTPNNFNKKQILSMALNWGTESNRQRLMDGFGFSEDQIKEMMFTHLTKKDFDFAQSIWKHLDTYKPDITALEMKTMGVEPKYIDSSPFETPWGTYEGGYYPLGYDYQKSMEAKTYNDQKNALYKQFPATSVHTESGYTKARVAFLSRPIRLDPDVLVNHLENVVHDLSFRQGVIDVNRLLRQRDTREAILNAVGQNGYSKIQDDLKAVASDQGESFSKLAGAVQWFRYRGTMSILGVRVKMIPIVAAADVINSVRELGPIRFAGSMSRFVFDPKATTEFVRANSESMAHRSEVRDRDLYDLSQRWFKGKPGLARYVFAIHGWVDQAFTIPMWKTVYDTALDKYGHQKAADLADESINRRFGSNSIIDQAGFQRGSEFKKVWTTGYSWMNMMFNQTWLDGKIAGLQYDKGNYFKASMGIARAGFYLALPGVAETLIREWFHNNQDDNEEASKKRLISGIASFPFKTLPVVSSIAEMGIAKSVGLPAMSMEPAVARSFEEAMKPVGELGSKGLSLLGITDERDISDHFTEDVARTISSMTGVPQSADDIAFAFLDSMNGGGELTWRDLVSRRTKH